MSQPAPAAVHTSRPKTRGRSYGPRSDRRGTRASHRTPAARGQGHHLHFQKVHIMSNQLNDLYSIEELEDLIIQLNSKKEARSKKLAENNKNRTLEDRITKDGKTTEKKKKELSPEQLIRQEEKLKKNEERKKKNEERKKKAEERKKAWQEKEAAEIIASSTDAPAPAPAGAAADVPANTDAPTKSNTPAKAGAPAKADATAKSAKPAAAQDDEINFSD